MLAKPLHIDYVVRVDALEALDIPADSNGRDTGSPYPSYTGESMEMSRNASAVTIAPSKPLGSKKSYMTFSKLRNSSLIQ